MLKVTIDRSRWLRGEGPARSFLLREEDGKMCCLGFACIAAGCAPEELAGEKTPGELGNRNGLPGYFGMRPVYGDAMELNDSIVMAEDVREASLTKLLSRVGIELEFVDGPVPS